MQYDLLSALDEDSPRLAFIVGSSDLKKPLYLDIETIPNEERRHLFGFDEIPAQQDETPVEYLVEPLEFVTAGLAEMTQAMSGKNPPEEWIAAVADAENGTGKKPRKGVFDLLASLREAKSKGDLLRKQQEKEMATTPEMLQIVAIGIACGDGPVQARLVGDEGFTEAELLDELFEIFDNLRGPIVGFNVANFDIPALCVRAMIHGIKPSRLLDRRPWGKDICDLMECRFQRTKAKGLKELAKLYGIVNATDGVDGSQVSELWKSDRELLRKYLISDLEITRQIHGMYKGFFC